MALADGFQLNSEFKGRINGILPDGTSVRPRGLRAFRMNAGPNGELQRVKLKKNRGRFAIEVPYLPFSTHTYCNEGVLEEEVLYSSVRFVFVTENCERVTLEYRGQEDSVEVEVACRDEKTTRGDN